MQRLTIRPRCLWTAFAALGLFSAVPAVAQQAAPANAASTPAEPSEKSDKPCPYTAAVPDKCPNAIRITIGFRINLGDDLPRIESIVRNHPLARIGWPADFEISRDTVAERLLVLHDKGESHGLTRDEMNTSYFRSFGPGRDFNRDPVAIGMVDQSDLAEKFDAALRDIVRVRALNLLADDWVRDDLRACVIEENGECIELSDNPMQEFLVGLAPRIGVKRVSEKARFVYVLAIDPDNDLSVIITPADNGGRALAKNEVVTVANPFEGLEGRSQLVIIDRDQPFDPKLLVRDAASGRMVFDCQSGLEPELCSALSGTNVATPDRAYIDDPAQDIRVLSYYVQQEPQPAAGGGRATPENFAPWQAQIYSTQTYTRAQIEADSKRGRAGRFLAQQRQFQLYHRCGGSVIGPNIVLTAAHCVAKGENLEGLKVLNTREVRLGTQNLNLAGDTYRIEAVVVHDGYRTDQQRDDLAVLRIARKTGKKPQTAIKLPHQDPGLARTAAGSALSVLGWGFTREVERGERHEFTDEGAQFAQAWLQIADLEILSNAKCRKLRSYEDIFKTICAVTPSWRTEPGRAFSCRGDSGGPIIQQRGTKIVQVGVVSGGVGCGAVENGQQNPSRFVDLTQYAAWLEQAKKKVMTLSGAVERLAEPAGR